MTAPGTSRGSRRSASTATWRKGPTTTCARRSCTVRSTRAAWTAPAATSRPTCGSSTRSWHARRATSRTRASNVTACTTATPAPPCSAASRARDATPRQVPTTTAAWTRRTRSQRWILAARAPAATRTTWSRRTSPRGDRQSEPAVFGRVRAVPREPGRRTDPAGRHSRLLELSHGPRRPHRAAHRQLDRLAGVRRLPRDRRRPQPARCRSGGACAVCHANPTRGDLTAGKTTVDCDGCHASEGVDFHERQAAAHVSPTTSSCFGAGCHDASKSLPAVHAPYVGPGSANPTYATTCELCHQNADPDRIDWATATAACTGSCHSGTTHSGYCSRSRRDRGAAARARPATAATSRASTARTTTCRGAPPATPTRPTRARRPTA